MLRIFLTQPPPHLLSHVQDFPELAILHLKHPEGIHPAAYVQQYVFISDVQHVYIIWVAIRFIFYFFKPMKVCSAGAGMHTKACSIM